MGGWLRSVGSIKFWVSLAEYCLFYRSLLQKRPVILRSLRIVAAPYLDADAATATATDIDRDRDTETGIETETKTLT